MMTMIEKMEKDSAIVKVYIEEICPSWWKKQQYSSELCKSLDASKKA